MRYISLRLLIALATFLIGFCAVWFFHLGNSKSFISAVDMPQQKERGPMIMEASMYYGGMYTYVGELLQLRVYESGYIEYEVLDENRPTRKSAELNADELRTLISLSERTDLLDAKNEYPAFFLGTDTYEVETITLAHGSREKKIIVHNPEMNVIHNPKAKSNYPPSLISLLQEVRQIRGRLGLKF